MWARPDSPNLGVQSLAFGGQSVLEKAFPGSTVVFQDSVPTFSARDSTPWASPRRRKMIKELLLPGDLTRACSEFEAVLDMGDGDSYTDAYGLSRYSSIVLTKLIVRRSSARLLMGPQTVGPFTGRLSHLWGAIGLSAAESVAVRDPESRGRVPRRLDGRVIETTDVCFALPQPEVEAEASSRPASQKVLLNVSGLLWCANSHVNHTRYQAACRDAVSALRASGFEVHLLTHVQGDAYGDSDLAVASEVSETLDLGTVVAPKDVFDSRRLMAQYSALVGSRMHAVLNALSVGTPAISLSYSAKAEPLLRDLGWRYTLDLRESQRVGPWLREVLPAAVAEGTEEVRQRAHSRISKYVSYLQSLEF